jgi:RNA polymerase sigma factor (sigma-70 family)
MANSRINDLIQHVRGTLLGRDGAGFTDAKLLEWFVSGHDEAAFTAIVRRHGPLVWGVCRRLLRSHHDAEDAFQATFLVLARKAASIASRALLANWLYGVAHRTALKAKSRAARRQARERQVAQMPEPKAIDRDLWGGLELVLDQELSRLPDKYRNAIILCDLEGKTRKQAARELGVPEGTVASRLATARDTLAKRLARHGLALSGAALAAALPTKAAAGVPPAALSATIKAVTLGAAGQGAGTVSANVALLTEGVLKAMFIGKLVRITVLLLVLGMVASGGWLLQQQIAAETNSPGDLGFGRQANAPRVPAGKPLANEGDKPKVEGPLQAEQQQDDLPPQDPNTYRKPGTKGVSKTEVTTLLSEIAKLRVQLDSALKDIRSLKDELKEIRSAKDSLGQGTAPRDQGPLFQGKPVRFWMDQFNDADPKLRAPAVKALGHLAQKNKELIPVLVDALKDPYVLKPPFDSVGRNASEALARFGPDAVPVLLDVLKDKTSSRAALRRAAESVGMIGPKAKAAAPLLAQALKMDDWDVRYYAFIALSQIGPDSKPALPAMIEVLGDLLKTHRRDLKRGETNLWDPSVLGKALSKIDPEIQEIVPGGQLFGGAYTPGAGGSLEDRLAAWQQAYESLKKRYQEQK